MSNVIPLKNSKDAGNKRISSVDQLLKLSSVDFSKARTPTDRLTMMRDILVNSIPVAEGYFRKYTSQSSSYALSNLINQLQGIEEQIENQTDWEEVITELINTIVQPAVEGMLLELGKTIRHEVKQLGYENKKKKKAVQKVLDSIYRKYGKIVTDKTKELEEELHEYMIS